MKKYISLVIAFVLLFVLAACSDDKENEPTTTNLPLAVDTTTAAPVVQVSETKAESLTYILTTQQGQTMPTVVTTAFNLANEITSTTAPSTTIPDFSFTVPSSMTAPNVVSEKLSTTETTKKESQKEDTTETETKPEDKRERKNLEFNSSCFNSSGNLELSFELAGWNGIKAGKISGITVTYDGSSHTVEGYLKQGSDGGLITVYTKDLSIPSETVVSCTIPAGAVVSKNGNIYNMSYTFSTSTGADPANYE